jgi:hypothetical protein
MLIAWWKKGISVPQAGQLGKETKETKEGIEKQQSPAKDSEEFQYPQTEWQGWSAEVVANSRSLGG